MKYIVLDQMPCLVSRDELYPGERLSDVIARAMEFGVSPGQEFERIYDTDDADNVDPACDIRTDRFALAERAEHQRTISQEMTRNAQSVSNVFETSTSEQSPQQAVSQDTTT